ncbi:hypothetical protein [Frigoriglobus tundricola]|uniref:Thioredoxin domain-containing protein n=1 Tax=Frigoriglobus tundricola TaxID=2774151 RepID=A0A6M5Z4X7_9BACT|nr:hypothetical protein [Frigoriglobus tundricola]QJX01289.1 hypothetical protein FTUN_8931 [Frigoriglobus tundricola]
MLKKAIALGVFLAGGLALGAEPAASGPQVGEKVPGPFKPLNATGPDAGKEECLYCKQGSKPMVMVFARELTPGVAALIKKLDAATAAKSEAGLASCVIVLSDAKDLAASLGKWAQAEKITHTVLATYAATGPAKYALAPDAAVTVLLYTKHTVKANHTFRAGELKDAGADAVVADIAKILPRE